ncbi:PD-(D/E)XK nuclease family protein [Risungbinella massiliensis]|uniref:PD-(D/E)XK nuclease family protein n=1 Tax=Risungbinella massiliensis TaxID=1329796 RepID=UPI0009E3AF95|nr:PD-(D/E)XK nuclease family protein [Risungbinella massiliensis]
MSNEEVLEFIKEAFEENYELMRLEGGHSITNEAKERALQQVLLYWEKLHDLAEQVTDTEITLTLPEQTTPEGRKYTIQGVVDIVQANDETTMYDVKTHDLDTVQGSIEHYEGQLNIYSYIWKNLRQQPLDSAAIIATGQTEELKQAYRTENLQVIQQAVDAWEPVVEIPIETKNVHHTIEQFGKVVDCIESNRFQAPHWEKLKQPVVARKNVPFGTHVCRNCDARFSCDAFKQYVSDKEGISNGRYVEFLDNYGDEQDRIEWIKANMEEETETDNKDENSSKHLGIAARAFATGMFARYGYDVSVRYGAESSEYDLIIAKGAKILKVAVKASQDGDWGIVPSGEEDVSFEEVFDAWLAEQDLQMVYCLVQFQDVGMDQLPGIYLASPEEVAEKLKAVGDRRMEEVPEEWRFSGERVEEMFG